MATHLAFFSSSNADGSPLQPLTAADADPATSAALKDGAAWALRATTTDKGRGVFVGRAIPAGALVLRFEGPIFSRLTCPDFSEAIQVGVDEWMWSSGGLDDLVNHSCEPNLGLWQVGACTYLLSLRDIAEGEELSFDYSTSMVDEPWDMEGCLCGAPTCRGLVGNFLDMPLDAQQRYARLRVLPRHVWATAHARDVGLENCPVAAGLMAESPEQKEDRRAKAGDREYRSELPPPAALPKAGELAAVA